MKVERVVVGKLEENCYIISNNNHVLVVDPGDEFNKIKDKIGKRKVDGILITHHHFDHIGALDELVSYYKIPIYDYHNSEEKDYNLDNFNFKVIYNPGHTIDSISFYFEKDNMMFVGDFVFKGSIGRCDLEGGNFNTMKASLDKIKKYSNNIILYPGHGDDTTLKDELLTNPFLI